MADYLADLRTRLGELIGDREELARLVAFVRGKTTEKPKCLVLLEEHMDSLDRYFEALEPLDVDQIPDGSFKLILRSPR